MPGYANPNQQYQFVENSQVTKNSFYAAMNAYNLYFTLNISSLSLFTHFYKMLHVFCQSVNNLCYILKYLIDTQILHSYTACIKKTRQLKSCR